ncbi:MAG: LCP family protein [Clostridia bacterium]|nr:LCP family protein [Clostridia bacterium]
MKPSVKKGLFALLLAVLLTLSAAFGVFASKTNLFRFRLEEYTTAPAEESTDDPGPAVVEEIFEDESVSFADMEDVAYINSLSQALKDWALNDGEKMSKKAVLNVLLVGADNRSSEEKLGHTDSIMLASIDRANKKITLTSFYRDSFTYIDLGSGQYGRINNALPYGGADCLVETIENDYKIKIDYYAVVDFMTFVDVVDAVGGVDVAVQEYEADYINYAYDLDCPYGESVTLDGELALAFCRIRHSDTDADVSRTRRQRDFITALIKKCSSVTLDQIGDIVDSVSKYVKTDCPMRTILYLASQAVVGGWYKYDVSTLEAPDASARYEYAGYGSSLIGNAWVFVVDYPKAAQTVQTAIYGESNIILEEHRYSVLDLF